MKHFISDQNKGTGQQRVAIVRALASEAPMIFTDELSDNLDEDTAQDITGILKASSHEQDKCVVVVTHSNELAKQANVVSSIRKGALKMAEHTFITPKIDKNFLKAIDSHLTL